MIPAVRARAFGRRIAGQGQAKRDGRNSRRCNSSSHEYEGASGVGIVLLAARASPLGCSRIAEEANVKSMDDILWGCEGVWDEQAARPSGRLDRKEVVVSKRLPIIYGRGFARGPRGMDEQTEGPFYGFNRGSTGARAARPQDIPARRSDVR